MFWTTLHYNKFHFANTNTIQFLFLKLRLTPNSLLIGIHVAWYASKQKEKTDATEKKTLEHDTKLEGKAIIHTLLYMYIYFYICYTLFMQFNQVFSAVAVSTGLGKAIKYL